MDLLVETASPEETQRLGEAIGRLLEPGDVVALDGELGAGKTELVRGLARGLDLDPGVIYSPSFTLVAEHEGRVRLNHIDLFRLGEAVDPRETEIGLAEYLAPEGVTAVEWAGRLAGRPWALEVRLALAGGDRRRIELAAGSARGRAIVGGLRARLATAGGEGGRWR